MPALARKQRGAYAGPACPRCGLIFDGRYPPDGQQTCARCGGRAELASFDPPKPAAAAVRPIAATSGASCARHERNAAVATCDRCGSFMCTLCRIDADGKALCAACFARLGSAGELVDVRTKYRHYNGMALHMAVLAIFFWPLMVLLGPLAIFTARRGLKQSERLGEDFGAVGARIAIGLGALETVGGAFAVLALFGAFK